MRSRKGIIKKISPFNRKKVHYQIRIIIVKVETAPAQ